MRLAGPSGAMIPPQDPRNWRARLSKLLGLLFWVLITFAVAAVASQFEPDLWYQALNKPTWTPPGWVFGPVWGLLYLSMGIAAGLIWQRRRTAKTTLPLAVYVGQLMLNGMWSWLFFGEKMIGAALLDLLLLVLFVAGTLALFIRVRKAAGLLIAPYLLWVCFAAVLNFQIWRLN